MSFLKANKLLFMVRMWYAWQDDIMGICSTSRVICTIHTNLVPRLLRLCEWTMTLAHQQIQLCPQAKTEQKQSSLKTPQITYMCQLPDILNGMNIFSPVSGWIMDCTHKRKISKERKLDISPSSTPKTIKRRRYEDKVKKSKKGWAKTINKTILDL